MSKLMNFVKRPFSLKDYSGFDSEGRSVYLCDDTECEVLLETFFSQLIERLGRGSHFPVLRIADGEFQFLLGKSDFNRRKPIFLLIKNLIGSVVRRVAGHRFEARSRTYTSGVYSKDDLDSVEEKYAECLSHVATYGFVCLYTIIKPGFYTEHYLPRFFKFLDRNGIELDATNYMPFYFIYIILTNDRYSSLYMGRKVHLVTSFNSERQKSIENSLVSLGVSSISWTHISRDRSLFDRICVEDIERDTDIVFVGAGLGKVNIFNQLKGFPALIIDAGYIFEIWQNRELAIERDYCSPH